MDKSLFFVLFLLLAGIYFIVGYLVSRSVKSVEDYFLAGRKLNFFQLAISLTATQLGGGFILGTSKEAYNIGYFGILYVLGVCIGLVFLASGVAGRLRLLNVETTAQLFETHYNSPFLKKVASICSIISLVGIFAAQIVGSRALMVSLDVFNPFIFTLFWLSVIMYAMLGGLKAIVQNDIFQLALIIVVFVGIFIFDVLYDPHVALSVFGKSVEYFAPTYVPNWPHLMMVPLMPALYSLIEQDLAQVFFAARNSRIAVSAAWFSALFLLLFAFIPLFFGMKARIFGITVTAAGNPLISFFNQTYNSGVVALITYGVFAAVISSANSVLCAISSNIVQDFALDKGNEQRKLFISKVVMFLVGCIGLILAFQFTDLIHLLVESYAVPVTGLLISLLVVYYSPHSSSLSKVAAFISVFSGLGSFILFSFFTGAFLLSPSLDALIVSALGYIIGYIIDYMRK